MLTRQACPSLLSVPTDMKTHGDSLRRKLTTREFASLREGAITSCESSRIFSDPERPTQVFSGRSWLNGCKEGGIPAEEPESFETESYKCVTVISQNAVSGP
jgi:hypothetical protein